MKSYNTIRVPSVDTRITAPYVAFSTYNGLSTGASLIHEICICLFNANAPLRMFTPVL